MSINETMRTSILLIKLLLATGPTWAQESGAIPGEELPIVLHTTSGDVFWYALLPGPDAAPDECRGFDGRL